MNDMKSGLSVKRFSVLIGAAITLSVLFSVVSQGFAAYRFPRPITTGGGVIRQWHLWGF